ncbi:MAG: hypothetical protein IJK28_02495 [Clostridia bacterium]|nr:hypothetical protein [Clostridia bacterium]
MHNSKVRIALIEAGMKHFQLARLLGMHEQALSRKLREELPPDEQDRIVELIRQHAKPVEVKTDDEL